MKKFDVVVFGSTGFTGRLVCRHIAENYHGKVCHSLWLHVCGQLITAHPACLSIHIYTDCAEHSRTPGIVCFVEMRYVCCLRSQVSRNSLSVRCPFMLQDLNVARVHSALQAYDSVHVHN